MADNPPAKAIPAGINHNLISEYSGSMIKLISLKPDDLRYKMTHFITT